jgi:hypothetical protein
LASCDAAQLENDEKQPQVLRLRLAQKTSQTPLRMTAFLWRELMTVLLWCGLMTAFLLYEL